MGMFKCMKCGSKIELLKHWIPSRNKLKQIGVCTSCHEKYEKKVNKVKN